jgi:hypothetical protein
MSRQTFDIFDGAGNGLATVTLYNMGVNMANEEAVKLAKSLSDDWAVARADESQPLRRPTIADASESSKPD